MLKTTRRAVLGAISAAALVLTGPAFAAPKDGAQADRWQIPVHTKKLANGVLTPIKDGDELILCRLTLNFKSPSGMNH